MTAITRNTLYKKKIVLLANFYVISKTVPSANTRGILSFESMNMQRTYF